MHQTTQIRFPAPSVALLALLLAFTSAAPARAADLSTRHHFEIPAQPLDTALLAFSDQTKVQVLMWAGVNSRMQSSGASGELVAIDALKAILASTGLAFRQVDAKTVAILQPG